MGIQFEFGRVYCLYQNYRDEYSMTHNDYTKIQIREGSRTLIP